MGEFRFRVPVDWQLDPYHANSIHVVGLDGIPWPCRIETTEDPDDPRNRKLFSVIRNRNESGRLYIVYRFENRGEQLVCTGTLPVRDEPYDLCIEVARGTLNRLRNQVSIWEEGGLNINAQVRELIDDATSLLGSAILSTNGEDGDQNARQSLENTMDAIFLLADLFAEQISKVRREHPDLPNFWVANQVGIDDQFVSSIQHDSFDLVQVKIPPYGGDGPTKETVEGIGKRAIIGPWLDASVGGMSQELINVDDFLARKDQLIIECRQMLRNLPTTASLLHVVSGLNGTGHRHLSYPQQLQVTVDLLKLIEESSTELPTMVSFDFPWAERLAGAVGGVHPLQIADSLLRQGLSISFLGLDINLDYWPNGSAIRDPLQWIDLVDIWAQLGMPLVVCLRCPFNESASEVQIETGSKNQTRSDVSDQQRIEFLNTVLPMLVARPSVHGLIMRQWQDQDDRRFPFAGYVDTNGDAKVIDQAIQRVRNAIVG
ncbi:MAG: hypothetical protein AAFN77_03680 [Planctomycetota bacterium]